MWKRLSEVIRPWAATPTQKYRLRRAAEDFAPRAPAGRVLLTCTHANVFLPTFQTGEPNCSVSVTSGHARYIRRTRRRISRPARDCNGLTSSGASFAGTH